MIFIAVGTQKFQMNRMLRAVDDLIEKQKIHEKVLAQTGYSDYVPQHFQHQPFMDTEIFDENIQRCDLLITHGGVGTIVKGMKSGKPVIVFPRLARFKEHVDDHQLQIAQAFGDKNYVLVCQQENDLIGLIQESRTHKFDLYTSQRQKMLDLLDNYLAKIENI